MPPLLYAHPFSSYCWKALIALYENATPFTLRLVEDAEGFDELGRRWPFRQFPVLVEDGGAGEVVAESTILIEHLQLRHPGPAALLPEDAAAALRVRFLDRVFDNQVMTPMQKIVGDRLRDAAERDARGVAEARGRLDTAYAWLESRIGDGWAAGEDFSMADCAGAPALFYADWVHPLAGRFPRLAAYRARLLARPSVACVVDEARPYRAGFPGGAPDRD